MGPRSELSHCVLGIDAAWTAKQPSGLALVGEGGQGWDLLAVAPSYARYIALEGEANDEFTEPRTHLADVAGVLNRTQHLTGHRPDVIAVDMPLARCPISARRASDDAVSRAYGGRHCSTHTPSAVRPGPISDQLTADFSSLGFGLATNPVAGPALIEVYPHPALVELMNESRRLPYKAGKVRSYWPTLPPSERRCALLATWARILTHLEIEIAGVTELLPLPAPDAPGRVLKAFEDMLDAVVCAWVGMCFLEGRATAFGDEASAIWIPNAGQSR